MRGEQEPRIRVEPERAATDGTDAAFLMQQYGFELDEWQRSILDCWLGRDKDGKRNVTSAGLSCPRQNGKNAILEAREFFGMLIDGEQILHTAHQVRTSKKSFRRLAGLFTDKRYPEITDAVKQIRYTNGEECIELTNGGIIEFSARSRQAARGFAGISLVVFDEAQELTDDQVEAIMATLSASATGTRQLIYTGTPPYPGCPGDVFRRRRSACTTDPGQHDSWHEWSVAGDKITDIAIENEELWYMTNPALGIRLSPDFTREEMRSMSSDGFARERLGWWAPIFEKDAEMAIDANAWARCASNEEKPNGKTAFGVKFSVDGAEVCLCGCVIPEEGPARVSMIERKLTGYGIQWLADWLNERYTKASCVVIDGKNGVDVLVDKMAGTWRAKGSILRPRAGDIIAAVSMLSEAVTEGTVTWYEPQTDLNDSAISSTKRPIGHQGGWGFGGDNPLPVEACALAMWGAKTSKRNPARKMRIG